MALYRHEPWSLLNQLSNELIRLHDQRTDGDGSLATADWVPPVDIREEEGRYLLCADLPGVEPKDIDISMENGVLSIQGSRYSEEKSEPAPGFKRVERSRGRFYRRFTLPDTADADRIAASSKNGVLEISIPKQEKLQPRRIEVQS
ncbi:Hsp20/alpha crystallin family protein [Alkalilimnicola sp. S0819]|uniref:Hsp20/alpha crystallin family protein n=1 Tax=Alkalilimnicola sp. S0819 TaxID=2613922 RepID=UPI0012616EF7|nr:Hsp20/alpha crystallin family protein [Alkalilimnicola sp. S0819]KAB7627346.1 Hsp20/alpha crystallin family protein [Alkalilimnicola sp. S0819]MPQ16063.1 Hsp20 family protein [Alkalilimnicola sp. S0819]